MSEYHCSDCGAEVSGKGRRCKSCAQKALWTQERKESYSKRVAKAWEDGVYGDESYRKKLSEAKKEDWDAGVYGPRRPPVEVQCEECGESFKVKPSTLDRGRGRFCSRRCRGLSQGAPPAMYGKNNPMAFIDWTGENNPNWRGGISTVMKACETCGQEFETTPYQPGRFCSRECQSEWLSEYLSGENCHWWRGGVGSYRGPNWYRQARKARERDDYTCQECGLSQEDNGRSLDVHHIVPFRIFDDYREANKLNNLVALCISCHKRIENETDARLHGLSLADAMRELS